jgi:chorismate dehydratase
MKIGGVSYLNARPLLHGLEDLPGITLTLDVPARLLDGLRSGKHDVALLPIIDYQKMSGLRIVPVGGIGCDGPTLTVRIFSPVPIDRIETLACDPDSHTSVVLAQIILAERYQRRPRLTDSGAARLLIGDKVVTQEPADMPYQLDLGLAWKELTGLPFVFAVWTARGGMDLGDLPRILQQARRAGMERIEQIVRQHAVPRGWPPALATQYLTRNLHFEIGPDQLQAMERFFELAAKHGLIDNPPRPLLLSAPGPS